MSMHRARTAIVPVALLIGWQAAAAIAADVRTGANLSATRPSASAPLTGTLFHSETERARLDQAQRTRGIASRPTRPDGESLTINGWVRHSSNETSVWIDGKLIGPVDTKLAERLNAQSVGNPGISFVSSDRQVSVKSSPSTSPRGKTRPKPASERFRKKKSAP
jgi:hypothetical protein